MLPIVAALGASVAWGVADFLGGLKSRHLRLLAVLAISQSAGLIFLGAIVLARGQAPPEWSFAAFAGLAGLLGLLALSAFYRGLAVGTMSIVAPVSATGVALPVVVGLVGGERLGALQVAGTVAAIAGVILASRTVDDARTAPRASGLGYALLAALGFGVFFVVLPYASQQDVFWAGFVQRLTSVAALLALLAFRRERPVAARGHWPGLVAIGVFDVLANVLYAAGATQGLLSVTAVLASLYPVVTMALAYAVIGERLALGQRVGVAAALLGVALIAAR